MTRSFKLFAVAVLAVVLVLSSMQNAFAVTELAYDNGTTVAGIGVLLGGVLFSLPSGAVSAELLYVRWTAGSTALPLTIHITGPDHVTELPGSPIVLPGPGAFPIGTGCPVGWNDCRGYDLTSLNIVVTGDFYIILDRNPSCSPKSDNGVPLSGRSFFGTSLADLTNSLDGNFAIRVDIDPTYPSAATPVGGVVEPVNKLAVLAPYLALFGLVATAVVVVAAPWKKSGN